MLEAQRIARDTWLNAANDAERTLLENVLVVQGVQDTIPGLVL